jgi:polyhydroxybutyrate depolymerase
MEEIAMQPRTRNTALLLLLNKPKESTMKFRVLLTGCAMIAGVASASAQNTIDASLTHDGLERTYRLYIPAVYNAATPVPLVLNLHGYGSNNLQQEFYGDFRAIADTANFIIVHPNGTEDPVGSQFWSSFGVSSIDDVGFLSALIDKIQSEYSIDNNCIYSTGMSNGGFMSYELACQLSYRIAAIASVTGSMVQSRFDNCNATHPTPVMQIHGTADPTVPYLGLPAQTFMPIETLVNEWVAFNNCDPNPVVTQVPNTNLTDSCTAELQVFENGDDGTSVEFYKVDGGLHTWPGSIFQVVGTNQDFSASQVIWRFFRKYKLDMFTGISEATEAKTFGVYPNPTTGMMALQFEDASERMITVTNAIGQEVLTLNCVNASVQLELTETGVYAISVLERNQRITKKVVVN